MEDLIRDIMHWGDEKSITNPEKQFNKLAEEMLEAHTEYDICEMIKGTSFLYYNHFRKTQFDKLKLEIGDIGVVWILLCNMLRISPKEALQLAHNKNKDRKGKTINGTFIKEEDL